MKSIHQIISLLVFCSFSFCFEAHAQSILMGSETAPTGIAKDTLLFYNQEIGALRFGNINTSQNWNLINLGRNSFAGGQNTLASGLNSVALGDASIASGNSSISLGRNTQSTANHAFSAGQGSDATGISSVAMGENTLASGGISTAFGSSSDATGNFSFAAGKDNIASGESSVAIGTNSVASGKSAIAIGDAAMATHISSFSLGSQTQASGVYSFAIGRTTHAKALNSFVIGRFNEGLGTETSWELTEPILEVGIGADVNNKANALTILKNGNHGIGTSAPMTLLDVRGTTRIERASSSSSPHLELYDTNDGYGRLKFSRPTADSDNTWTLAARPSEGDVASRFNVSYSGDSLSGNILSVTGLGRLGVNTTPSDALHVNAKNADHAMRVVINNETKLRVLNNGGTTIGINNTNGTPSNGLYVKGNTGLEVSNPTEKLEVNGAIVLGSTSGTKEGAIRYNQGDFEGYNGTKWVSLTAPKSIWGDVPESTIIVEQASQIPSVFDGLGDDIDMSLDYAIVGSDSSTFFNNEVHVYKSNGDNWDLVQEIDPTTFGSVQFGASIDISGDYFIAGAHKETGPLFQQGAAYIYKRNGATWELDQKLINPIGQGSSFFGASVAIKGIHAVVASREFDGGDLNLHIYRFQGGIWVLQQVVSPSGTNDTDFMQDIVLDLSADGEYILCGVPSETVNNQTKAGNAYVFIRSGSTWSQQGQFNAIVPEPMGNFGYSVAFENNNIVIGCQHDDVNGLTDAGSVYIFKPLNSVWILSQRLFSPGQHEFGNFGNSIAMDNGHLLISQPGNCQNTSDYDRVSYLYKKEGGYWTLHNILRPSNYDESTLSFGKVAMSNDRIIIGTNIRDIECQPQEDFKMFFFNKN